MSLTLFRDTTRIEPPDDIYERRREGTIDVDSEDVVTMFHKVPAPTFAACEQDIWLPNFDEDKDEVIEEEHVPTWQEVLLKKFKVQAVHILDHNIALILVFVGTFWALFAEDMAFAVPLDKDVDKPFAWTNLFFLIFFTVEQTCRSIAQYEEYCFTFFWWMELVRTRSMGAAARVMGEGGGDHTLRIQAIRVEVGRARVHALSRGGGHWPTAWWRRLPPGGSPQGWGSGSVQSYPRVRARARRRCARLVRRFTRWPMRR